MPAAGFFLINQQKAGQWAGRKENKTMATNDVKLDISHLLGFFECELSKEKEPDTLNKIRHDLIETLSFMSGFDVKEIENTLEETKM